mmetsp:Transcript_38962/g.58534  ORF Transcript_38962/g.58534 Transcript_38962/m.58534 type:complete len:104 (-) Transcript_38962:369-680(-)
MDAEHTERILQHHHYNNNTSNNNNTVELKHVSAGTIADLCNVTRELKRKAEEGCEVLAGEEDEVPPYTPLKPYELPVASRPPHIEPGRVDIRMMALYDKLGRI